MSYSKRISRAAGIMTIAGIAALAVYAIFIRSWILTWGATSNEVLMPLPGDELSNRPTCQSTRAVTINIATSKIWPWLLQIGQDRGGFYSYSFLENLVGAEIRNFDRIVPEWQERQVGDLVRSVPADYLNGRLGNDLGWRITEMETNRLLVLKGWGSFILDPVDDSTSRLIIRTHSDMRGIGGIIDYLVLQPLHFIMERRMLMGIKQQAEAGGGIEIPGTADLIWLIIIAISVLANFIIALSAKWPRTLIVSSLTAILMVLVIFLLPPVPIFSGALLLLILAAITWAYWPQWQEV